MIDNGMEFNEVMIRKDAPSMLDAINMILEDYRIYYGMKVVTINSCKEV